MSAPKSFAYTKFNGVVVGSIVTLSPSANSESDGAGRPIPTSVVVTFSTQADAESFHDSDVDFWHLQFRREARAS